MKKIAALILIVSQIALAANEARIKGNGAIVNGALSVGTSSPADSKTVFDVVSTTKGSRPCPPMSEAQRDAITSPATGSCVFNTDTGTINKYDGAAWAGLGSGGGSGGLNFVTLDSNHEANLTSQSDFETTAIGWAAYADAAGVLPVDATGGSPTVTCTRTTTTSPTNEVGNGTASLKVTKDAANRQGQGCSLTVNIPPQYRGKTLSYFVPAMLITGSWVSGDVVLSAYDVTNGEIVNATAQQYMIGARPGTLYRLYPKDTAAQLRLAIHIATTSAAALSFSVDDVKLDPYTQVTGAAQPYLVGTITWAGVANCEHQSTATTYTNFAADTDCNNPTVVSSTGELSAPSTKIPGFQLVKRAGVYQIIPNYAGLQNVTSGVSKLRFSDGTDHSTASTQLCRDSANCDFLKHSPYTLVATTSGSVTMQLQADVSSGTLSLSNSSTESELSFSVWYFPSSSNVTHGESGTFKISEYLATGSRVTGSAPSALGQYRSYLRDSSAGTYTETNGAPGTSPSAANGMLLYGGNAWNTADSNNEPSRYDIFVGRDRKQANVNLELYATTGRSGDVLVGYHPAGSFISGTTNYGAALSYNPSTGIATVLLPHNSSATTAGFFGVSPDLVTTIKDGYFDVVVSENTNFVSVDSIRSSLSCDTWAGYGSTDTKVPYFTTCVTEGTAVVGTGCTGASSTGCRVSFTEDGIYSGCFTHGGVSGSSAHTALSLGTGSGTTDASTLTTRTVRVAYGQTGAITGQSSSPQACFPPTFYPAGTVIKPHTNAGTPNVAAHDMLHVTKVNY